MKKTVYSVSLSALLCALLALSGCAGQQAASPASGGTAAIVLSDSGVQISGGGAKADGRTVSIVSGGTYSVSGSLSDGELIVDTGETAQEVTLVLEGVGITNLSGPAIHIRQAKNTHIQLAEGSANSLISGTGTDLAPAGAEASGAALYAEDDLDIDGPGLLEVRGYINNGIASKDDLDINGGTLSVTAVNNGIRGAESVEIKGGAVSVESGNDGVKSASADKEGKGYIRISGGSLSVTAAGDGISAETELTVEGGSVTVLTTGDPSQASSKAVKAKTALLISGGELTLTSADHALHSGGALTVSGGTVAANSTGGKALAAHGEIAVSGGTLALTSSGDGVETPENITLSGGELFVSAGDDALQAGEANTGRGTVALTGGSVQLSAGGQAVNARGELVISGGTLFALGNSDKVPSPSSAGTQPCIHIGWAGAAGDELSLLNDAGEAVLSGKAGSAYHVILLSAPELEDGAEYSLSRGMDSVPATAELP